MIRLQRLKHAVSYLCGFDDEAPPGLPLRIDSLWWAAWWTFLLAMVILFCGQSSKFIYIDF